MGGIPPGWTRRGDGTSHSHGAALMLGRRAVGGMVADTHPRIRVHRPRSTGPGADLRWPGDRPARLPPAHRGARATRAPHAHVVRRRARPGPGRVDVRLGHHDRAGQPRRRHLPRPQAGLARGDPARRAAPRRRPAGARPVPARAARGTPRARGRGDDAVPPRRRGAAPQRRPRGRPALRLRHELHGRRAQRLRLLRPAGPQGAVHDARDRTVGLGRDRQRPGGRAGLGGRRHVALGLRPHSPAVDVLRDPGGRALPRDPRRARRHPAGDSAPGSASRPPSTRTPRRSSPSPSSPSTSCTGCSGSATRSATTTRRSCPSSTPGRWRTRAA